ncbi:hypothetical protein LSH36_34g03000, partial [Paralvinella palmiformis]
ECDDKNLSFLNDLIACSNRGNYSNVGDAPPTIPTVGTNLVNVVTSKKTEITVRELGGCMAPIWHNYYKDCQALMFMIDVSNKQQVSSSCIQLMDVINHEALQTADLLIILNKIDVQGCMSRLELDFVMRLNEIQKHARQKMTLLDISARQGKGLQEVTRWIQQHTKH